MLPRINNPSCVQHYLRHSLCVCFLLHSTLFIPQYCCANKAELEFMQRQSNNLGALTIETYYNLAITMCSKFQRLSGSCCALGVIALFALVLQAALAAITITLVTTSPAINHAMYYIAWAAAIADSVTFLAIAGAVCHYLRNRRLNRLLRTTFGLVAIFGACLTITTLAWQKENGPTTSGAPRGLTIAGFILWVTEVITQTIPYATLLWLANERVVQRPAGMFSKRLSPAQLVRRSISARLGTLPPSLSRPFMRFKSELALPSLLTQPSSPKLSFRHSVHQFIRPISSKTKLLLRHPSSSRDSYSLCSRRETSLDSIRHDNEFENWDTSGHQDVYEDCGSQRAPKTRLETIPGSRRVSSASAFDGPFPTQVPKDAHLPSLLVHPPAGSPSSDTDSFLMLQPPTPPNQLNIHRLPRSKTTMPPPVALPGSVITASPFAGRIIDSDPSNFRI